MKPLIKTVNKAQRLTLSLLKSHVESYLRRTPNGGMIRVREHEDSRTKKLESGAEVYFRTADGKRARRGHVISEIKGGYAVQGKREAGKFRAPTFRLPEADVWTVDEQSAKNQKSGQFESLSSTKRTISVKESNRRAQKGYSRLGMAERDVLLHPKVREMKISTLKKLASSNSIVPQTGSTINDDFADLHSHYVVGLMNSLRLEASKAPKNDLDDFKAHLAGKKDNSRVFATITTAGRGAAIRFLQERAKKIRELIDFQTAEEDPEMRRELAQHSTPASQFEELAIKERNKLLDGYLAKLSPLHAEIIFRKFALGSVEEPQSDLKIAEALNRLGFTDHGRKFNRNGVSEALRAAMTAFRELQGLERLRDFLKSLREHLTLLKSQKH